VAHHLVDRGTYGFREASITQAGWDGLLNIDNMLMADSIQLFGGHSRHYIVANKLQHFSG
jgi:hypothetical protein